MNNMLVVNCGDGRTNLGLVTGLLDYATELGIAEIASIASTPPPGAIFYRLKQDLQTNKIVMIFHHHDFKGCGGLMGKKLLDEGGVLQPGQLHDWIANNLFTSDLQCHVLTCMLRVLSQRPNTEIVALLLDHASMLLEPLGMVTNTHMVLPSIDHKMSLGDLPYWVMPLMWHNLEYADIAKDKATERKFAVGQSFANVVANATTIPVETNLRMRSLLNLGEAPTPDPYFRITIHPEDFSWSFAQLLYGYSHLQQGGTIAIVGKNQAEAEWLLDEHQRLPIFEHYVREKDATILAVGIE